MKCAILLACIALTVQSFGQTVPPPSAPSAEHAALQSWRIHVLNSPDSTSRNQKLFHRWNYFWEGRTAWDPTVGLHHLPLFEAYSAGFTGSASGPEWEFAGPHVENDPNQRQGRVECIAVPPNAGYPLTDILLGTPSGGIWRTTNGGASWYCTTDDDFNHPGLGCHDLVFHPENPLVVYAGISIATTSEVSHVGKEKGYGLGIYRSEDGGETWLPTGLSFSPTERKLVTRVLINPSNPLQMYAAVNDQVLYTEDGWDNHAIVFDGINQTYPFRDKFISDLAVHPDDFTTLWVTSKGVQSWTWTEPSTSPETDRYHSAEVWKGTAVGTNGEEWSFIELPLSGSPYELSSNAPTAANALIESVDTPSGEHLVLATKAFSGDALYLWRSTNGGEDWNLEYEGNLEQTGAEFQFELAVSPSDPYRAYVGQNRVHLIQTYPQNQPTYTLFGPHIDTRALVLVHPESTGQPEVLLQGNDGGIAAITHADGSLSWDDLNGSGLNIQQLFGLDLHRSDEETRVVCGSQDNSGFRWIGGSWDHFLSGDRYKPIIHSDGSGFFPVNPSYMSWFTNMPNYQLGGSTASPGGLAYFNRPVAKDNLSGGYIGYSDLWYRKGLEGPWQALSNIGAQRIRAVAVAEDPNVLAFAYAGPVWNGPAEARLFVSFNGQSDVPLWTDLTPLLEPWIGTLGINALAFDPLDPYHLVLGFEYFESETSAARVLDIQLNPADWNQSVVSPIGHDLPNVPVNCIAFVPGFTGDLMLGNDMGVFRRNADQAAWERWGSELPMVFVSDLVFDVHERNVWIATFGRGLWKAPLGCGMGQAHAMKSDLVLHGDYLCDVPLIVPENVHLEVNGTIRFSSDAGITVMPGGRLTLEEAHLMPGCPGERWAGIRLIGQPELAQHPNFQAVMDAHQSTIEGAQTAILVGAENANCDGYGSGGGLLRADGLTFNDNVLGVHFAPYRYSNDQGFSLANTSYLSRCSFRMHPEQTGVRLESVNRLNIDGCAFNGDLTSPGGTGIESFNATFAIGPSCDPFFAEDGSCNGLAILPKFHGLKTGIRAAAWMDSETFRVFKGSFAGCTTGVTALAVQLAELRECTFEVPSSDISELDGGLPPCGVRMTGCSHYLITDNDFSHEWQSEDDLAVGLTITDSGDDPNDVYRNDFSGLRYAILAQGDNKDHTPNPESEWDPGAAYSGLQFRCNRFWDNRYDLSVTLDGQIAPYQGNPEPASEWGVRPAYNEFYLTACDDENNLHINPGSLGFQYFFPETYATAIPDLGCYNLEQVWPMEIQDVWLPNTPYDFNTVCPQQSAVDDILVDFESALGSWEMLQDDSDVLFDDGDTQGLIQHIANPAVKEQTLRALLMHATPFLSDPVLEALIDHVSDRGAPFVFGMLSWNTPVTHELIQHAREQPEFAGAVWREKLGWLGTGSSPAAKYKARLLAKRTELNNHHKARLRMLLSADSLSLASWKTGLFGDDHLPVQRWSHGINWKTLGECPLLEDGYPDDEFASWVRWMNRQTECPSPPPSSLLDPRSQAFAAHQNQTAWNEYFAPALPRIRNCSERSQDGPLAVKPNPAQDRWEVSLPEGTWTWILTDPLGAVVSKGSEATIALSIPAASLPTGAYTLVVFNDIEKRSARLMKAD